MSIEQKPEAWIIVNRDTGYRIQVSYFPDLYNKDMFEVIPLYTHPNREQTEQEPVGYLYKQMDCTGEWATIFKVDKPYITWHDIKDIVPVYTSPPNHEQDSITDATLMAYMPNGSAVSNVYEAYEEGRKSVMSEQEPVAWMNESGGCFLSDGNKYSDLWTPLYTAPQKREPINHNDILDRSINGSFEYRDGFMDGVMFAEKMHGIGGGNE